MLQPPLKSGWQHRPLGLGAMGTRASEFRWAEEGCMCAHWDSTCLAAWNICIRSLLYQSGRFFSASPCFVTLVPMPVLIDSHQYMHLVWMGVKRAPTSPYGTGHTCIRILSAVLFEHVFCLAASPNHHLLIIHALWENWDEHVSTS